MTLYGLVLQGGGAKGAYQIGVWKALRQLGIQIVAVTGTSIGAINGAFIVLDKFDDVYDLWYNANLNMGINGDSESLNKLVNTDVKIEQYSEILKFFRRSLAEGGLDVSPMKDLIKLHIDESELRRSTIDYGLVTVSLTDFKSLEIFKEDIPTGKLHDYIMASANLPIFKTDRIDGKLFVDGAFYDNLPVNLMASKGYKDIIAVKANGIGRNAPILDRSLNLIEITPSGDTGTTMEFIPSRTRINLKMGYVDTMRRFNKCLGSKYCLDSAMDEDYCLNALFRVDEDSIFTVGKLFGEYRYDAKRLLFEVIIPAVAKLLRLKADASYFDIIIGMVEHILEHFDVDPYERYRMNEIRSIIKEKLQQNESELKVPFDLLPDIVKQSSLVKLSQKDKLIIETYKAISDFLI